MFCAAATPFPTSTWSKPTCSLIGGLLPKCSRCITIRERKYRRKHKQQALTAHPPTVSHIDTHTHCRLTNCKPPSRNDLSADWFHFHCEPEGSQRDILSYTPTAALTRCWTSGFCWVRQLSVVPKTLHCPPQDHSSADTCSSFSSPGGFISNHHSNRSPSCQNCETPAYQHSTARGVSSVLTEVFPGVGELRGEAGRKAFTFKASHTQPHIKPDTCYINLSMLDSVR